VAEVLVGGWSLVMSIVENRSRRTQIELGKSERMFSVTCICVEILVAALAIYALISAILLEPPAASTSKAPAGISFVGP
jgi:hypothetical protein